MALTSPGVEVTIIDESQYLPAPTNSVPLVVLATAQNKANASGTGIAQATTAANANKLFLVTSQRDLVNLYGVPFFYTTSAGTPVQGYELNEYGLLAAYSLLGVTNRCYVLRADIDLASLVGQTGRPVGEPVDGTWWLDTTSSTWGIFEFNATTGKFTQKLPIVITDTDNISSGYPLQSIGNIGDYAVNAIENNGAPSSAGQYFYKTPSNTWAVVGGKTWKASWPTVQGSQSNPTLTVGDTFDIGLGGMFSSTITVGASSTPATVDGIVTLINNLGWGYLIAANVDGKLSLYDNTSGQSTDNYIEITAGTGTVLEDLGITAGTYIQPGLSYGTAAEMPLWSASQTYPRPTGSVWIKVGAAGSGLVPTVARYSTTTKSWSYKNVSLATSDWSVTDALDSTGGKAIPAGSVYAQYDFNGNFGAGPVYLWERLATGATVVTGTETNFSLTSGPYTLYVQVSVPGSNGLSSVYTVTVPDNATPTGFVTAWSAANIPYTGASVTTDGAIQLTHTEGGEIVLNDCDSSTGVSNGLLSEIGVVVGTTSGCKYGPSVLTNFTATQTSTSGSGTNLQLSVTTDYFTYILNETSFANAGSGYAVGDTITFAGASLGGTTPANNLVVKVVSVGGGGSVTAVTYASGTASTRYTTQLSNWVEFTYTANEGAPNTAPANNTNWFYSVTDQVDVMVNYNGAWYGYKNINYDSSGFPTPMGSNATDPNGPIISNLPPTTQSDGTALVYGDLWVSTADLENYPVMSRWESVDGEDQWVLIDNADQTSSKGVVFADARWATNGSVSPTDDPIPTIVSLLSSDYLDLDAPSPTLYPTGMLLFNTRRSGYNVKEYKSNYFNSTSFPGQSLPVQTSAWVSVSGLESNGAPYMGRKAQRNMVVKALKSVIDTNTAIRDEDNFFNLMATPNYPELQPNMVLLNSDRGETCYIIGDTPMGLADDATEIQAWATNAAGASSTGEDGLVTRSTYLGLFYPSGLTNDLSGNLVAVPASHMMLRTFLRSDSVSYPWLAAAGTRRGTIDNATNIGYLDRATGEFITIKTRLGIRDTLYTNQINPLVFFTGVGLLNYGNKNSFDSQSALDRTNVARLVAYLRRQLTLASRPLCLNLMTL